MSPRDDVVKNYKTVPEDFVKHLLSTLAIVVVAVLVAAAFFGVPEKQPLTIRGYANAHPVQFEQVMLRALDGTSQIATYGPPYNHVQGNIQTPLQSVAGVIHPVNTSQDLVLKPLRMAAQINPSIRGSLARFQSAPLAQKTLWETNFTSALNKGTYSAGAVHTGPGRYGPLPALMNDSLNLGKSGLMSGALTRNTAVYTTFDSQNLLLLLQGAPLQQDPATQSMQGPNWGIIHPAVNGYPGAWWMTIPTWIYQWPVVANSSAPDGMALTIGFFFWLALALTPWIPGLNRLPRYLGVHRLIWKNFYRKPTPVPHVVVKGEAPNAS